MPERTKLEAHLFRYSPAADAEVAEALNQMSEAESQALVRQLAHWGEAGQTIIIDLSGSSYNCDNRIEYPDGSKMSRLGSSFSDGQRSAYDHIFEALNITRLTQAGKDPAEDRPPD